MKKTSKKLVINREKLRELVDTNLDRVNGGYVRTTGSDWCSSTVNIKCGGGPNGASKACVNP